MQDGDSNETPTTIGVKRDHPSSSEQGSGDESGDKVDSDDELWKQVDEGSPPSDTPLGTNNPSTTTKPSGIHALTKAVPKPNAPTAPSPVTPTPTTLPIADQANTRTNSNSTTTVGTPITNPTPILSDQSPAAADLNARLADLERREEELRNKQSAIVAREKAMAEEATRHETRKKMLLEEAKKTEVEQRAKQRLDQEVADMHAQDMEELRLAEEAKALEEESSRAKERRDENEVEMRDPQPPPSSQKYLPDDEDVAWMIQQTKSRKNERRAMKQAETGTTPDDLHEFTPRPAGGDFPVVHRKGLNDILDNVSDETLADWGRKIQGAKIFVQVSGYYSHGEETGPVVASCVRIALNKFDESENVIVVAGGPEDNDPHGNGRGLRATDPPAIFFAWGMSDKTAEWLLEQRVIRTKNIRLHCYPFRCPQETFVGLIEGLRCDTDKDLEDIRELIIENWKTQTSKVWKTLLTNAYPEHNTDGILEPTSTEFIETVIDTLVVKRLMMKQKGGIVAPTIQMYLKVDVRGRDEWHNIRCAISEEKYGWSLHNTGVFKWDHFCSGCRGADHPLGLCPFESLENDVPLTEPLIPDHIPNTARTHKDSSRGKSKNKNSGPGFKGPGGGGPRHYKGANGNNKATGPKGSSSSGGGRGR